MEWRQSGARENNARFAAWRRVELFSLPEARQDSLATFVTYLLQALSSSIQSADKASNCEQEQG